MEKETKTITITVKGGCVVDVEGLPKGYDYLVDDQDDIEDPDHMES